MVFLREVSFSLAQKPKVKTKVSPQDAVMAEFEDRYRGTSIIMPVRRWGVVGLITKLEGAPLIGGSRSAWELRRATLRPFLARMLGLMWVNPSFLSR